MLAGPPPRTPPGTIDRQGHNPANAQIVTGMHGSARKCGFSSNGDVIALATGEGMMVAISLLQIFMEDGHA